MISLGGRPDSGLSNAATTGSLRGTGGPRAGSTAPPSFAELRNPTLSNSKISYDSNTTASLPLLVRPWSQGYEQGFRQGSLIFVADADCNAQMCTAADLPTLNFLIENARLDPADQSRRLQDKILPKNLEDLLEKWKFFGVMRNDMMANSMLQKLYNCDVYGRAMVANIFGSKLKRGDLVGLAVVKISDIRDQYQMYIQPDGGLLPSALIADGSDLLQIVGTVNGVCKTMPNAKIQHKIPLGVISHAVAKVPSNTFILRAMRETEQYMLLPRIEILMI
jgi:hypothetical protein